jgi:hypothetical protein
MNPRPAAPSKTSANAATSSAPASTGSIDQGNTVVIIEHNLDVIKTADRIIDLGPDGGDKGGRIVATGTPDVIAACAASHTGHYLAPLLVKPSPPATKVASGSMEEGDSAPAERGEGEAPAPKKRRTAKA